MFNGFFFFFLCSLSTPILLFMGFYGFLIEFTILTIIYVFILYFNDRKMTFIKDESNNKLNIVIANYFCCSKKTTISLQNKSFFVIKNGEEKSGSRYKDIIMIIIYNTNLNEIDLDNTNIQSIPFKLM